MNQQPTVTIERIQAEPTFRLTLNLNLAQARSLAAVCDCIAGPVEDKNRRGLFNDISNALADAGVDMAIGGVDELISRDKQELRFHKS